MCDEENCNHITGCEQRNVMDGTAAEDHSDVTQNSTKYDQYSNKSIEKGHDVILNCSSGRPYITRPFQNSTMLIILCFLTSAFFVIIVMYIRLNKRPTTCPWS